MPAHDWTRVFAGIFHHFHQYWLAETATALNEGLLPPEFYALAEQTAGEFGPDVLALQLSAGDQVPPAGDSPGHDALTAVATRRPPASIIARTEMEAYARRQNSLVIRHTSGDRVVALVEILSPGNKASRNALRQFIRKAAKALSAGCHLLIADLHPPGPRDPQGIHGAIWEEIEDSSYRQPTDRPLTAAAYDAGDGAGDPRTAYVQPFAIGQPLPEMPLFLYPGRYVTVPLERTYQAAFRHVPARWRRVLETSEPS